MNELWTPEKAKPKWQCNVPGCGAKFHADEQDKYIRHVTACVERNRSAMIDLVDSHRQYEEENPLISGLPFDPEALEFQLRKNGSG